MSDLRNKLEALVAAGDQLAHSKLWPPLLADSQAWDAAKEALLRKIAEEPQGHIFDSESPSQDCSCGWKAREGERLTAKFGWEQHVRALTRKGTGGS